MHQTVPVKIAATASFTTWIVAQVKKEPMVLVVAVSVPAMRIGDLLKPPVAQQIAFEDSFAAAA